MKESQNYHIPFEDAQDYINKCGFDIPWNDGDVFVDEREITRTIGNVLKWRINSVWHDDISECKDVKRWIVVEYNNGYVDVLPDIRDLDGVKDLVVRVAYVDDLLPERKEETNGGR